MRESYNVALCIEGNQALTDRDYIFRGRLSFIELSVAQVDYEKLTKLIHR
jgi:hypothetical protein